jgi:hypothetical protein
VKAQVQSDERLAALTASWPSPLIAAFSAYRSKLRAVGGPGPKRGLPPYWQVFPGWLLNHGDPAADEPDLRCFLREILWGQFCLYLSVRIRDDLLDGQAEHPTLLFAAEELLLEAEQVFSNAFPEDPGFAEFLRQALTTTNRAILEVDALQRSPTGMPPESVELYARVCEIFKVSSRAACTAADRLDRYPAVASCCNHLAMAGQILDDFADIDEDLARGRFNYAVSLLLGPERGQVESAQIRRRLAERLLRGPGLELLTEAVRNQYRLAKEAIASLYTPAAEDYIEQSLADLDQLKIDYHQARVEAVFGNTLRHSNKMPKQSDSRRFGILVDVPLASQE